VLNLLLPGGSIKPVELDQLSEVRLDNPKLQQELVKALAAVSAARDQDSKPVTIHFTGNGQRRVRIGYVVEAPVWKASYRLVLGDDVKNEKPSKEGAKPADAGKAAEKKGAALQGWAIVENQTDGDWENVQLSLVSGRPISFVEDLYQPLFISRPVVEPELYASLRPQNYAQGMDRLQERAGQEAMEKRANRGDEQDAAAFGALAAAAPRAPGAAKGAGRRLGLSDDLKSSINPTRSISSAASGASVGEFFEYTVGDVSLPRQKSAMIPIVADTIEAARLSIYNAAVLADHPLLGARLVNTTGKLLPQGPITVLDGNAYAGDASIEDLPTGQNRLLSYGIDQSTLVHSNDATVNTSLVTGKIVKGVLELTHKRVFIQKYVAQNKGKSDRTLLIEHPRRPGSEVKLVAPDHAIETTDSLYRFEEDLPANSSKTLTVQEEVVYSQGIAIMPMDDGQAIVYLRAAEIPEDVKKALQQAGKLKSALVDTQRQIQERQTSINDITQEQNRIRENMKAVAASSDYYQRLLKELDSQETQIQKLKAEAKDLKEKQDQQRKELEEYLGNLNVG
jgi:hypothetical protein